MGDEPAATSFVQDLPSAKQICIERSRLNQDMVKIQGVNIMLVKPESNEKERNAILGLRTEDYVTRVERPPHP